MPETKPGSPVWELALVYPRQGEWTESSYFDLQNSYKFVEFNRGYLEFLEVPPKSHERLIKFLEKILARYFDDTGRGEVFKSGLALHADTGLIRVPDISVIRPDDDKYSEDYPEFALLVVEVVSDSYADRKRDLKTKVEEYQQAGIPEYWIVDPKDRVIHVLSLQSGSTEYTKLTFELGNRVVSGLYSELEFDVADLFAILDR